MEIQYQTFNFRESTLALIKTANDIVAEYMADGYELTLRQLYYQFVARGFIPNRENEYSRLGGVINNARLAGMLDWAAIVDRTRQIQTNSHWDSPSDILQETVNCYALDTRSNQTVYVEVWVEKEALAGILERACEPLDVTYFSCRGYVSQSAMWRAAQRIQRKSRIHEELIILYLGDHDPSGIDMSRDIQKRFEIFGTNAIVNRIALNLDQIEQYNPPPNPAKLSDSRCQAYIAEYGDESWELDALDPRTINDLITAEIEKLTEPKKRKLIIAEQESQREKLQMITDKFDELDL